MLLLILGSAGILAWMTFRFADFRMGAAAIAALIHDVIVVVGVFAILGTFIGLEVDALFVTAMLTVIGFSVHDTIVVFDRVRENRIRHAGEPFSAIVNHSLLQTLGRSLSTSITVTMVLLALLLFGSDAIRAFVLAMVVGIISGTYSSIFNASMILVSWHEWDDRRRTGSVHCRPCPSLTGRAFSTASDGASKLSRLISASALTRIRPVFPAVSAMMPPVSRHSAGS